MYFGWQKDHLGRITSFKANDIPVNGHGKPVAGIIDVQTIDYEDSQKSLNELELLYPCPATDSG